MGSRLARCRTCNAPVVFFRSPFTGRLRTFDPTPVDGHHPLAGATAFPVQGRSAYKPAALVDQVQVQRACSDTAAAAEVRDMAWHVLHECPPDPSTTSDTDSSAPPTE